MKTRVNLEEEVVSVHTQKKTELNQFKAVADVKGLLAYDDTIDRIILRKLAPECTEVYAEKEFGRLNQLENLEKQYGSKAIARADIEALALKYRLRFLPSRMFNNSFTPEVIADLKKFAKKHDIDLTNEGTLTSKFFILGPREVFKMEDGVKRSPLVKPAPPIERISWAADPALFYKTDDDTFVHIRTWGGDFSVLRAIKGHVWKNHTNFFTSLLAIVAVLLFGVLAIGTSLSLIASTAIALGAAIIIATISMFSYDGFFSNQVWDSPRKNEDRKFQIS